MADACHISLPPEGSMIPAHLFLVYYLNSLLKEMLWLNIKAGVTDYYTLKNFYYGIKRKGKIWSQLALSVRPFGFECVFNIDISFLIWLEWSKNGTNLIGRFGL